MRRLILLAAIAGALAACETFPTLPEPPRCLKVAAVMTDARGVTIGDTTWAYISPVEGQPCTP